MLSTIASRYLRFCRARCAEAARLLRLSPLEDECCRAMARRVELTLADAARDAESAKVWAAREWPR